MLGGLLRERGDVPSTKDDGVSGSAEFISDFVSTWSFRRHTGDAYEICVCVVGQFLESFVNDGDVAVVGGDTGELFEGEGWVHVEFVGKFFSGNFTAGG